MQELKSLVNRARDGDLDAFSAIVRRFQDMALGYAYSILGRFDLAEDAAQEAFIQAYRDLPKLREPAAFPGWFRKVVFKHCDRLVRGKRLMTVPLDEAAEIASDDPGPAEAVARQETRERVLDAIDGLPETERTVTTLFYINGYSQNDIAEFLELPATTVNNRLHASRKRLKERIVEMVSDELRSHALSEEFPERIRMLLGLPRPLEIEGHPVRVLWDEFRAIFPDFVVRDMDEITDRPTSMLEPNVMDKVVYAIDERRILRPELTSQFVNVWIREGGGPCRRTTCGRVFRVCHDETETMLEVHHQAEVFWVEEGLDMARFEETMRMVSSRLMPGAECRLDERLLYPLISDGKILRNLWRGQWIGTAAGGVGKREWLEKGGLDPDRYGLIGFAFGLERTALVRFDLDDARKLWQPPYVPG